MKIYKREKESDKKTVLDNLLGGYQIYSLIVDEKNEFFKGWLGGKVRGLKWYKMHALVELSWVGMENVYS